MPFKRHCKNCKEIYQPYSKFTSVCNSCFKKSTEWRVKAGKKTMADKK